MLYRTLGLAALFLVYLHHRRPPNRGRCGLFSHQEFEMLNSGHYHDSRHAHQVADLTERLSRRLAHARARTDFLVQVALLHDADPRWDEGQKVRLVGTPARVPVTLSWLGANRERMMAQMAWDEVRFAQARALIARTEFPFDDLTPRCHGTEFDGATPVALYRQLLLQVPAHRRQEVMEDGLLLRYADQAAAYVCSFPRAAESLVGLAQEWSNQGRPVNLVALWRQTPDFLNSLGRDLLHDQRLCRELKLDPNRLPQAATLSRALGWRRLVNLRRNQRRFARSASGQPL